MAIWIITNFLNDLIKLRKLQNKSFKKRTTYKLCYVDNWRKKGSFS